MTVLHTHVCLRSPITWCGAAGVARYKHVFGLLAPSSHLLSAVVTVQRELGDSLRQRDHVWFSVLVLLITGA